MSVGGQAVCVCLLFLLLQLQQGVVQSSSVSEGKAFIAGFIDTLYYDKAKMEFTIATSSPKTVLVTVSTPGLSSWESNVTVTKAKSATVIVPSEVRGKGTELANKGVYITASEPVSVFGMSKGFSMTDSYLALPIDLLGTEYYAATYSMQPVCMIIGTQAATQVSFPAPYDITYQGKVYSTGSNLTIALNKFQTYHMHQPSNTYDFTGMHISSTKPVAVLCGNKYSYIGSKYWDHLVEMMPPVDLWGTNYYTVHVPRMKQGEYFVIVALEDRTSVKMGEDTFIVDKGKKQIKLVPSTVFLKIEANKPIMVTVISRSYDPKGHKMGDPSLYVLTPAKLFGNTYTWGTPIDIFLSGKFKNSVTVVISKKKMSGLELDGKTNLTWAGQSDILDTDMVTLWIDVSEGGGHTHTLTHSDPSVTFMAMLSGETSAHISNYISPAGLGSALLKCHIMGDPHLETAAGQTASVAIPCSYPITKQRLLNPLAGPNDVFYREISAEVWGGNSQRPLKGRFYASGVCVKVTLALHTNTYCSSELRIESGIVWSNETGDAMQGRVLLSYDAANKQAILEITHTGFRVTFRPVNRKEGNLQTLKPGISVEVQSRWLIPDLSVKFPATLCSTFDDTTSIAEVAAAEGVSHRLIGIFSVVKNMESNMLMGDQDAQCPNFQTKLQVCSKQNRNQAIKQCFGLMRTARIERCLVQNIGQASKVILDCLDLVCTNGVSGCPEMKSHSKKCHDISRIVSFKPCNP